MIKKLTMDGSDWSTYNESNLHIANTATIRDGVILQGYNGEIHIGDHTVICLN